MPGRIGFTTNIGAARDAGAPVLRRNETRRMLVLGDFSGRRNRGVESAADLASRPIIEVDVDNFDSVFRRLAPSIALAVEQDGAPPVAVEFETIDDFHPDHLYRTLEPFRRLRESRTRLLNPATFEQEAASMLAGQGPAAGATPDAPSGDQPRKEDAEALMQRLLGAHSPAPSPAASPPGVVDGLIRRLVQPHIERASTQAPDSYVAALDATAADLMRALLHHPDFQALEALWRGVRGLVDTLDLGSDLKLYLVDVSAAELQADLAGSSGVSLDSAAYRLVVDSSHRGADQQPWSLLAGQYRFKPDLDEITLLAHLGVIASHAGGPLLAEADPALVGCDALSARAEPRDWTYRDPDVEKLWIALRQSAAARWLGLAMPRVLLRLPYGAKTDRIESFAYEEFAANAPHEAYLWGNPALACMQVIGRAMLEGDDDAAMNAPHEIDDLPAHVRDQDGERQLQACAEFVLPLRVGEELLQRGIIPVLSYGNRNAVRVARIQSIAEPPGVLPGFT
jgi:type VI secretion system protein ImpC